MHALANVRGKEISGLNLTRTAKNTNQLRRAAAIVANGNHVAEGASPTLAEIVKYIHETIRRGAASKDDDPFSFDSSCVHVGWDE